MGCLRPALPLAPLLTLLIAMPSCNDDPLIWPAKGPCLHAHNDYLHPRPLYDALAHRACSVEADVFLVDGELRVAHHLEQTEPGRTLTSLYLEPLRQTIAAHQGSVYGDGMQLMLVVDIKTEAAPTWAAIDQALTGYASLLTRVEGAASGARPLLVLISGNRPLAELARQAERLAGLDGRLAELDDPELVAISPLVSDDWLNTSFFWLPELGELPAPRAQQLAHTVERAHHGGQRLRFWHTPDTPAMWQLLVDAGVDLLAVDDLAAGRAFLDGLR